MFSTVFKTYLPTKSTESFCIFKDGKNSLELGWFDDCKPIVFPAGTRKKEFLTAETEHRGEQGTETSCTETTLFIGIDCHSHGTDNRKPKTCFNYNIFLAIHDTHCQVAA